MSEPSETETIGHKRPPHKTQFKPGKSGNPRGRPKRRVDMSAALNKAFNDKVVVTGLGKTLTGMEAFVQSIVDRVLQGDSKAIPELVRLFSKTRLFKPVPDPTRLTGVVVELCFSRGQQSYLNLEFDTVVRAARRRPACRATSR
jgi:Family of unknown function (DUF5681)